MSNISINATWTGNSPCLCHGEWILVINGNDVSNYIPDELKNSPMNTYGEFDKWRFNEDNLEEWYTETSGLKAEEWISVNDTWLQKITENHSEKIKIFEAINASDWRYFQCGGCI